MKWLLIRVWCLRRFWMFSIRSPLCYLPGTLWALSLKAPSSALDNHFLIVFIIKLMVIELKLKTYCLEKNLLSFSRCSQKQLAFLRSDRGNWYSYAFLFPYPIPENNVTDKWCISRYHLASVRFLAEFYRHCHLLLCVFKTPQNYPALVQAEHAWTTVRDSMTIDELET